MTTAEQVPGNAGPALVIPVRKFAAKIVNVASNSEQCGMVVCGGPGDWAEGLALVTAFWGCFYPRIFSASPEEAGARDAMSLRHQYFKQDT